MTPLNVSINLQNLHCYDEADGIGDAEPYLWTVFFKIDGDTFTTAKVDVDLSGDGSITVDVQGNPLVQGTDGTHGNLQTNGVGAGDNVDIPPGIGTWNSTLKSLPLTLNIKTKLGLEDQEMIQIPGICGVILQLMEQDMTPDDAIEAGYLELLNGIRAVLGGVAPLLSMGISSELSDLIKTAVKGTIVIKGLSSVRGIASTFLNSDDPIGSKTFIFMQNQLVSSPPEGIRFSQRWTNNDSDGNGDWEITGVVTSFPLTGPRISVEPTVLRFPASPVGEISEPQSVTIMNQGVADLHVSVTGSSQGNFRWPDLVDSIMPGQSRVLDVEFGPRPPVPRPGTPPQTRSGELPILSDGGNVLVQLRGSVVPGSPR